MEDDYEEDNMSVGSLAMTDSDTGSTKKKGADDDSTSPEAIVRRKTRSVGITKLVFVALLILAGVFLSIAAYMVVPDSQAGLYAGVTGAIFAVLLIVFLRYDYLVARRASLVMDMAKRSRSIVDQLFPSVIRDRLLFDNTDDGRRRSATGSNSGHDEQPITEVDFAKLTKMNTLANQRLSHAAAQVASKRGPTTVKTFLSAGAAGAEAMAAAASGTEPIAELFPDTTVFFADVAGFTAWSSERDPPQVFRLLETLYGAFDDMAGKLKVFKVETIGDSYMAVTGLPEPDEHHAVSMARFAYQCLIKMNEVCQDLEAVLGPGTEELQLRIGLHSGPVTAGVLRGQKSRFQLFGDTVNTASRMESTGMRSRIQVSQETADLLSAAGKQHWIQERMDRIVAKGKGELRTYWLEPRKKNTQSARSDHGYESDEEPKRTLLLKPAVRPVILSDASSKRSDPITTGNMNVRLISPSRKISDDKYKRLIDWNTDVLLKYLSDVVSARNPVAGSARSLKEIDHETETPDLPPVFESVAEVIVLPSFDPTATRRREKAHTMESLRNDVRMLVSEIAALYNDVPFHNFEHASHVTLAANKLVSRMVQSDNRTEMELYERTFGISGDPLSQFAIVFAALIHDVGHTGVTNAQLIAEDSPLAQKFRDKSIAEQNSVYIAWNLLMQSRFHQLRAAIYKTNVERKRFRQVLINAVMATDIGDRTINQARIKKWIKAFREGEEFAAEEALTRDDLQRRATVVIEHLLQVADVAHTMQHWHIYRRWNDRLFEEMYWAYLNGRASFDPTSIWYRGEIAFFDYFVIPLAKKMKDCGVFGSAGNQYLSYAEANRREWEIKGEDVLRGMIEAARVIEPIESDTKFRQADNDRSSRPTTPSHESDLSDVDSTAPVPEGGTPRSVARKSSGGSGNPSEPGPKVKVIDITRPISSKRSVGSKDLKESLRASIASSRASSAGTTESNPPPPSPSAVGMKTPPSASPRKAAASNEGKSTVGVLSPRKQSESSTTTSTSNASKRSSEAKAPPPEAAPIYTSSIDGNRLFL